jgi:hypothetical protein
MPNLKGGVSLRKRQMTSSAFKPAVRCSHRMEYALAASRQ